jgi:triosephosphate isomerase (TIM)
MRRALVAGNWKMNLDRAAAVALATAVAGRASTVPGVDLAIFPPSVYLDPVRQAVAGSSVAYGAQNMYDQPNGAFTGEISASMLIDLGCRYVILGHSERRHVLGETNEQVNKKTIAALVAGLVPIVCVGELLAERQSGRTGEVIRQQVDGSLAGLSAEQMARTVIAYEPVWAIGTGHVASPEQAEEVHKDLRKILAGRYNATIAEGVRILYGGSVKASNAAELLAQPNVDGALVGGASLKADEFLGIAAGVGRK